MSSHQDKVARITRQLQQLKTSQNNSQHFSLNKGGVSHFVPNPKDPKHKDRKVNVSDLNEILSIDPAKKICVAEPGVTFCELVTQTLKHGLAPMLVPELKTITLGGAVSGCSVESMSYKYGGFHDSALEYEVITSAGEVLTCSPEKNADVFHMVHGSYGTLGIISKLTFRLIDAKPYVRMDYVTYPTFESFTAGMREHMKRRDVDFIDGILHAPNVNVLCLGTFVSELPEGSLTSDYTWLNIFYKSTKEKKTDYLTTFDYFFRYDTECHWLSRTLPGMETKLMRLLLGKTLLSSTKLLTWSKRLAPILKFDRRPDVVVDVFIPGNQLQGFYETYQKEIDYYPLWIVPYKRVQKYPWVDETYDQKIGDDLFIDIAVYGLGNRNRKKNYYKMLEDMTYRFNGIKTLISHNSYDRETFWTIYNRANYEKVKKQTDPANLFRDLYDKFHYR